MNLCETTASPLMVFSQFNPEQCYKPDDSSVSVATPNPSGFGRQVKEVQLVGSRAFMLYQKHHCSMCGNFPHSTGGAKSVTIKVPSDRIPQEFTECQDLTLEAFREMVADAAKK